MSSLSSSRRVFAVLFIGLLLLAGTANFFASGPALMELIRETPRPGSLGAVHTLADEVTRIAREGTPGRHVAWSAHAALFAWLHSRQMNTFSVLKADDGRLYRGGWFPINPAASGELADDIADFAEVAAERGANVLYVATPDTVMPGRTVRPRAMPYLDYNPAVDALLYTLRERGVAADDTRYTLFDGTESPYARTGMLFDGPAGFDLFRHVVGEIERRFGMELDPNGQYRNPVHYDFVTHPQFLLAQLGKETGPAFSGLDDFTTVTPRFESEFVIDAVDMFGTVIKSSGDAAETLLHPDALVMYHDIYSLYPEGYYVHANTAWSRVRNPRNPNGPRLLVVNDFLTAQLISLLAPMFSDITTTAYQEGRWRSAAALLEERDFDLILISLSPPNLVRPESRLLFLMDGEEMVEE